MHPTQALRLENQISSAAMNNREALKIEAAVLDPLTAADGIGGFLSTIFVVATAGAVVFGLLTSGSGEPLLLTILAVLAMLGTFMLLGIAAGHVRIGARLPAGDVLKAAADASTETTLIASATGNVLYWNPAHEAIFGRSEGGPLAAIEAAFAGDPEVHASLFPLDACGRTRRSPSRRDPPQSNRC